MKIDGILDYSIEVKRGERIFIFADHKSRKYCNLLCDGIIKRGAVPFIVWNDFDLNESFINRKEDEVLKDLYSMYEPLIDSCSSAIMLDNNIEPYNEHGINSDELLHFKNIYYLKFFKKIMNMKKWVYLRYPQQELADLFDISYDEHVKLLEEVSNFNYADLAENSKPLKQMMDATKKIYIKQGITDVTFTKIDIPSEICCGRLNLPDGEIFTAPNKYSVNGIINFNVDSTFRGNKYKNIVVKVENGKIVESSCNLDDEFKKILDSDSGTRYFGEFAFGLNPFIKKNYNDNLFNEKMIGTVHFAIGYPHYQTDNGNESLIHWDLIIDMKNDGEVYFDDILIQKNGVFLPENLKGLNTHQKNNKVLKKAKF